MAEDDQAIFQAHRCGIYTMCRLVVVVKKKLEVKVGAAKGHV